MSSQTIRRNLTLCAALFGLAVLLSASAAHRPPQAPTAASANEIVLTVDPAQSTVHYMVGSSLHTVHGTFALKRGTLRLDPGTGKATGEIVVDAVSGRSGNDSRDKKMHKEVLESARFTDISVARKRARAYGARASGAHVWTVEGHRDLQCPL